MDSLNLFTHTPNYKIAPPSNQGTVKILLKKLESVEKEEKKFMSIFEIAGPKLTEAVDDTRDLYKILREPRDTLLES